MVLLPASNATDERFTDTTWSIVIAAGATTPARAHDGMAKLCRIYWRPIYAYLRRSGYAKHDAEDLTQAFFQHLLENDTLRRASQQRGRFRSFLLGALKLCLADEHTRRRTLKRGGGTELISTDELESEELHSPFLEGTKPDLSYQDAAEQLNIGVGAVKTHIHRLRRQFASAVRREVMETVGAPHEVDDELRQLRGVFARIGQGQAG